jgi:hypothetical protein
MQMQTKHNHRVNPTKMTQNQMTLKEQTTIKEQ